MIQYVLGFLFDPEWKYVSLIHKQKPEWQIGKLNGIGGKIENDETPDAAMQREFFEETGVDVVGWFNFAIMSGYTWECHCFSAHSLDVFAVQTTTNEEVIIREVNNLPDNVIHNLRWLIPMAIDFDIARPVTVYYT